jgi:hypothetical protein
MAILGSNIFRFEGLDQLSQRVRVVRVLGLERRQADYFQNRNRLGELSRRIGKPVTFIERGGNPLLIVPIDALLPTTFNLPGRTLVLEPTDETFELSFSTRDPQWDPVRLRILNYLLQNPLYNDARLWQPQAGGAWFYATPLESKGVGLYPGAKVRAVALPGGGLGVSVDKTFRFIDTRPVSAHLSKDDFERHHRGHTHVYHYPTSWYEHLARPRRGPRATAFRKLKWNSPPGMPPTSGHVQNPDDIPLQSASGGHRTGSLSSARKRHLDDTSRRRIHRQRLTTPSVTNVRRRPKRCTLLSWRTGPWEISVRVVSNAENIVRREAAVCGRAGSRNHNDAAAC